MEKKYKHKTKTEMNEKNPYINDLDWVQTVVINTMMMSPTTTDEANSLWGSFCDSVFATFLWERTEVNQGRRSQIPGNKQEEGAL